MNKLQIFYGCLIGIAASLLGGIIFIKVFTHYELQRGITILYYEGNLGKLIKIGAILDLVIFFTLLKYKKDYMARGIILSLIVITIVTFFL